jgi:hypothetical protein
LRPAPENRDLLTQMGDDAGSVAALALDAEDAPMVHREALMTSHRASGRLSTGSEAYRVSAARDPRTWGFGYLAAEPSTGAVGSFVWFATPAELFEFLATTEVALLQFDERDSTRLAVSVRRAIGTTRDVARIERAALSAAFEGWCEIAWLGTFAELCAKGGSFATQLRLDFRIDCGLGGHAGPIADDELDRFVAYLATGEVDPPSAAG